MANTTAALPCTVTRVISRPLPTPRYVVELCQSALPIDPNDVPQLDLFALYHLYSDVKLQARAWQHSPRLGFFKEVGTAKAIARYVAPHFKATRVVQIDAAEIVRSLRRKVSAQKDIGASGTHEVIELATPVLRKKCRPCYANNAAVPCGAHARASEYS
jgi:hypothetical protein